MVLRRVAVRSGVPDYGYALFPDGSAVAAAEPTTTDTLEGVAR
jgi:hypothetical protein